MQAYELFTAVKPSIVQDMFQWMRDTDRNLYKTALNSLASNRKLRPAFIQKKSVVEQIAWIHKTLQLKNCDIIGEHLLQVYFMKGQNDMLASFCDGLEIPHDGAGQVEGDLPETLDADKLKNAIDSLLEKFEELSKALDSDERLKLS